jgi:hypothetical protein
MCSAILQGQTLQVGEKRVSIGDWGEAFAKAGEIAKGLAIRNGNHLRWYERVLQKPWV